MLIINRYITTTILYSLFIVLLVVFSLQIIIWCLGELGEVGVGAYSLKHAIMIIVLQLPYQLCELSPIICLVGTIMGLGLLTSNNEIIIFRLSGMSKWSIVSSIIKIGVLLGIFVFIGQNFFATKLVSMAHEKKMFYTSQGNAIRMPHGIWIRNNNDYIYIDSIEENKLKNVIRYTFDDNHRLIMGYSASYGLVQDTKLKLNNVKKTTFANEHISSSYLQEDIWNIVIPKHIIMLGTFYPEELTIKQLHDYRNKKQNLGVTGSNYEMLYWNRIFLPLQIIIMMLFAIPIIFSTLRQGKIGFRLLVGIGAGFTFFVINHIIGSLLIIYNITFSWILLLFLLVFLAMWALIYKYP